MTKTRVEQGLLAISLLVGCGGSTQEERLEPLTPVEAARGESTSASATCRAVRSGGGVEFTYVRGRLTSARAPELETSYEYDDGGHLIRRQARGALPSIAQLEWDRDQRVIRIVLERTSFTGASVRVSRVLSYDAQGRLAEIAQTADADEVASARKTFVYGADGHLARTLHYDAELGDEPSVMEYEHDDRGRLTAESSEGMRWEHAYETSEHRVATRQLGAGGRVVQETRFTRDPGGRLLEERAAVNPLAGSRLGDQLDVRYEFEDDEHLRGVKVCGELPLPAGVPASYESFWERVFSPML